MSGYIEPKTEPNDVYLGSEPARRDAMPTEPTVTITLRKDDADELRDNITASLDDWEYTEGESIPYLERVRDALALAVAPAPPACPVCNGLRRIPSGATYMDHIEYVACPDCVIAKAPDRAAVDAALECLVRAASQEMMDWFNGHSGASKQGVPDAKRRAIALIFPDGSAE